VGVPVFNRSGELLGALSATGPSLRFSEARVEQFVALLKEKAAMIRDSL
jgi:Transcriptional regulator